MSTLLDTDGAGPLDGIDALATTGISARIPGSGALTKDLADAGSATTGMCRAAGAGSTVVGAAGTATARLTVGTTAGSERSDSDILNNCEKSRCTAGLAEEAECAGDATGSSGPPDTDCGATGLASPST